MSGIPVECFYETQVTPAVGKRVIPDGWGNPGNTSGSLLIPCDDWDKADFRLPTGYHEFHYDLAVNVEVTGRTVQSKGGCYVIRVKVTFVGDCEPDTISGGWMEV